MIKITNKQIKALQSGELKESDFAQELIENYSAMDVAKAFVELLAMKDAPIATAKISVTEDELKDIISLFRVKGSSPRGRKPKSKIDD